MNRIIFYCFILTAFSTSLHGVPVNLLKEMIKDVKHLQKLFTDHVLQLRLPSDNDSGDLSCYVAKLKELGGGDIHGINKDKITKIISKLNRKAQIMHNSTANCIAHKNQSMNITEFLNKMLSILQEKFSH